MNRPIMKTCHGLTTATTKAKRKQGRHQAISSPPALTLPSEIAFGGSAKNIQKQLDDKQPKRNTVLKKD